MMIKEKVVKIDVSINVTKVYIFFFEVMRKRTKIILVNRYNKKYLFCI